MEEEREMEGEKKREGEGRREEREIEIERETGKWPNTGCETSWRNPLILGNSKK